MRRSVPLYSALGVVLLAGACSSGASDLGPAATLGTAPPTTSTTARPVDVAAIPDDPADIDETYVQAVIDALFAVDAEATKIFVETKQLDPRGVEILASIYIGEELDQQVHHWEQLLAQRPDEVLPGALRHSVRRILGVAADCVFVMAERDFAATTTRTAPPTMTYLGITPKEPSDDPGGRNSSGWVIFSDGVAIQGRAPEDPCVGR